jgi:hypothetical protein
MNSYRDSPTCTTNHHAQSSMPGHYFILSLGLCAVTWSSAVCAEVTFRPHADVRYEHYSNLFALPDDNTTGPSGRPPGTSASAAAVTYAAGADSNIAWGLQKLTLGADVRRVTYDHFSDLDNTGYTLNGDLRWQLGSRLDGDLGYRQVRQMSAFADQQGGGTQLQIQKTRSANAALNYKIATQWVLQPHYLVSDTDSPQAGFPTLGTHDTTTGLGIQYAGLGKVTFGIQGDYMKGKLKGVLNEPSYSMRTAQLKTNYEATGLSSFNAALGYSKREQAGSDPTSAVTGGFGYRRQVTGKTSVFLQYNRSVNTYVAAGSSELDNSVGAGASWNATGKMVVGFDYAWTRSTYEGQPLLPGTVSTGRSDRGQDATFSMDYALLRWLNLRPFARYQKRTSTIDTFTYHGTVWGIEVNMREHGG